MKINNWIAIREREKRRGEAKCEKWNENCINEENTRTLQDFQFLLVDFLIELLMSKRSEEIRMVENI